MARKLAFQKDQALQKAMLLFWKKGYEASSMEDLVGAMEINRFSIYNTFGDKKALLMLALEHYRSTVFAPIIFPLKQNLPAKTCLLDYFDNMSKQLSSASGSMGCLVQRTGHSHIASDPDVGKLLFSMLEDLKQALLVVVQNAKQEGSISDHYADELIVDFILSQIQGLILLRRYNQNLVSIESQIQVIKETVLSW